MDDLSQSSRLLQLLLTLRDKIHIFEAVFKIYDDDFPAVPYQQENHRTLLINPSEYIESVSSRKKLVFLDDYFIKYIEHLIDTQSLQIAFDTFRLLLLYKLKNYSDDVCLVFQLSCSGGLP